MTQSWDKDLTTIYNYSPAYPNVEPVPIDVETAQQAPTACVQINRQLIPYLAGLCEVYRNPNFFRGDEARRVKSAEILTDLQAVLLNADECDSIDKPEGVYMPIGTIFYNVSDTPPDGCIRMEGQLVTLGTYPEFEAVLPVAWLQGTLQYQIPDLTSNVYLESGLGSAPDVEGENNKIVPESALVGHNHTFDQWALFNTSIPNGGQAQVAIGNIPPVNTFTSTTGDAVPLDFRTARYSTNAYLVVSSTPLPTGSTGPTGADGPEGPAGPLGPPGLPAPCTDCPPEATPDPDSPINQPGAYVSQSGFICAGARRMAIDIIEDCDVFLQQVLAVIDASQGITSAFKIVGWTGIAIELMQQLGPPVITGILAQIDTNLQDDLTCDIYCAISQYGGWNVKAHNALRAARPLIDFDDLATFIPAIDTIDKVVALAINLFGSTSSLGSAYAKGSVNSDNYCEQFCNCPPCATGTANDILVWNNPLVEISPVPTLVGDELRWSAGWNEIRFTFTDEQTRCIQGARGQLRRSAAQGVPNGFIVRAGPERQVFDEGSNGNNELIWSFSSPTRSLFLTIRPQDPSDNIDLRLRDDFRIRTFE